MTEARRSTSIAVAAVATIHLGVGYAFLTGLSIRVLPEIPVVTLARFLPADETPPPPQSAAREARANTTAPRPASVEPVVLDLPPLPTTALTPLPPLPSPEATPLPPAPAPRSIPQFGRGATPLGQRSAWVTTNDYPAASLRAGAEGTTAIRLSIGADGQVGECTVTASSGDELLDAAACRAYSRRARFSPALDASGTPVASVRADRVTWRLPR